MRKNWVALATLALAGAASAQSSVTLFGLLDTTVSSYQVKSQDSLGNQVKVSKNFLGTNGSNASKLGFRGQEDLGGGLAASFWLEAHIWPDDGTVGANVANSPPSVQGFFSRRSTVSLSGAFGEVRLGRDVTPSYWNDAIFDPFAGVGLGLSVIVLANQFTTINATTNGFTANGTYARASNAISYFLPGNLGGFYGQAMYAFNEKTKYDPGTLTPDVPNNSRTGGYVGGRFGYINGPLDVATSFGRSTVADSYYAGITKKLVTINVGASYDFDVVKLFGEYSRVRQEMKNDSAIPTGVPGASPDAVGYLLGFTVPVGPSLVRFAYSRVKVDTQRFIAQPDGDPDASKWAIGYVYNLSKRTALYATYSRLNNKNGYDLSVSGSPAYLRSGTLRPKRFAGYDVGIRHVF